MRRRCENPSRPDYKWYGARGIQVCQEWQSFRVFARWALAKGYAESLTIDREDNDKDYTPGNCRWVTIKDQERNRRNTFMVTYQGKQCALSELAEKAGLNTSTVLTRVQRQGWTVEAALNTPVRPGGWPREARC